MDTSTDSRLKLIDAWVNQNEPAPVADTGVTDMFKGLKERRERGTTLPQLIDEMDAAGVERAVLCAGYAGKDNMPWMTDAIARHPERFTGSLVVDPREGMKAVRLLDDAVKNHGVRMARVLALETQLPYNDAVYYPIYTKCAELGIPIGVTVGIPGPRVPGRHQHPISLDEVCYYFPELTVVMSHGGDPWTDVCVKLMHKWPNLYYMSSAYSPRRLPRVVVNYMNSRGADKVMWASDYPILEFERCRDEILQLDLKDEERRANFAYHNARRLFFEN